MMQLPPFSITSQDLAARLGGPHWPQVIDTCLDDDRADNARMDLAPEAAGLLAASLGLSHLAGEDDHAMLRHASVMYDGLYAWASHAAAETHNWRPKA